MSYPYSKRSPKKRKKNGSAAQYKAIGLHEDLKEFEEFRQDILPMLRKDVKAGMEAEEMMSKYVSYITARGINLALTSEETSHAITMIKDILDRVQGRAVQREEITNKYDSLSDEELDAMLVSKFQADEARDLAPAKPKKPRKKKVAKK